VITILDKEAFFIPNLKYLRKEGLVMSTKRKALLIQGAFGAVILTLLMQPMVALGFGNYNWTLFIVLLLFFAMGADLSFCRTAAITIFPTQGSRGITEQ
jgi:type IV secretory pathway TrbD component